VKAILAISARDNVATALEPLDRGRVVEANGISVTAGERIAAGHKIALCAIGSGEAVIKYGSPIGLASRDIAAGAHVHTHNVASTRGRGDLEEPQPAADPVSSRHPLAEPPDTAATTQAASKADR
jgi:altronate hydrolase